MSARIALSALLASLTIAGSASAQPFVNRAVTVRIFTVPSVDVRGSAGNGRGPIVGDVVAIDAVAIHVRARATGRIVDVPLAGVERIERLKRHDPVADSMKLLAAAGGAWIAGVFAGHRFFGTATKGANLGAVVLGGAAAWAAYTVVLRANERERWESTDLDHVRAAFTAAAHGRFP